MGSKSLDACLIPVPSSVCHTITDGSPVDGGPADPTAGLQNAAEVSARPPTNAPSESSYPPEPKISSRSKKEATGSGAGKHHHSNHRSPNKKTSKGNPKGRKSTEKNKLSKKKDDKGGEGHRQHSSANHRSRRRSPSKGHGRSRSAENTLDSRDGGRRRQGRSPDRRRGQHSSPQRRRSPRRYRSPHRSRQHSPTRRQARSSDPYRRYASPERPRRSNEKPTGGRAALMEPARSPEPSFSLEDSVLREPPLVGRLNREAALRRDEQLYGEDSLLMRASSKERAYKGDSLLRDVASRGQRDAFRDTLLPRVRTPDSDSAFQKYSSLLRGRSPERTVREGRYASRDASPAPLYRARSLGRDISPIRGSRRDDSEDEEDDDDFVAAKVREYYSTVKTNSSRSSALPEPKKTYKDNPKDLSI